MCGHVWTWHVWTCLDMFGHDMFGHVWTCLDMFGHVWTCLDMTCVDMCGHVWTWHDMTCVDMCGHDMCVHMVMAWHKIQAVTTFLYWEPAVLTCISLCRCWLNTENVHVCFEQNNNPSHFWRHQGAQWHTMDIHTQTHMHTHTHTHTHYTLHTRTQTHKATHRHTDNTHITLHTHYTTHTRILHTHAHYTHMHTDNTTHTLHTGNTHTQHTVQLCRTHPNISLCWHNQNNMCGAAHPTHWIDKWLHNSTSVVQKFPHHQYTPHSITEMGDIFLHIDFRMPI